MKGAAQRRGRPRSSRQQRSGAYFPGGAGAVGAPPGIVPWGIPPGGTIGPGIAGAAAPPFIMLEAGLFPPK